MDNRTTNLREGKPALSLLLLAAVLLLTLGASCSKESGADARELLGTVPADAGTVMVTDAVRLLEKSGCGITDGKVERSPEMASAIGTISEPSTRRNVEMLLSGEAGITPGALVMFAEGHDRFLTFMVDDPEKFKAYAEKTTGGKFTEEAGVSLCGPFALKSSQAWVRDGSGSDISGSMIARFSNLSENQSFLSNSYAEKMLEMRSDIQAWTDLNAMINLTQSSFQQRAQTQLLLSSLMTDAAFATFTVNFEKDHIAITSTVLNSKGETAKCNFDTSKIDVATVGKLSGKADMLFAVDISAGLRRQIQQLLASFSGGVGGMYSEMLRPLDGTAAVSMTGADGEPSVQAVVSVDDKEPLAELNSMLSQFGSVRREGKFIFIDKKGATAAVGSADIKEFAPMLKGAWFGVVASGNAWKPKEGGTSPFSVIAGGIYPMRGGLEARVKVTVANGSAPLPALLKLISGEKR